MNSRINSRRNGQVTVFVILGIVIIVIVVFGVIISSSLSRMKLQSDAKKAVTAYLQSDSVNYFVYTCLDTAVSSSIYDLSIQGGVFYDYQNGSYRPLQEGTTHIPYSISWTDTDNTPRDLYFNVSYSILNNSYCGIVEENTPNYPLDKTFVRDLFWIYNDYNVNSDCLFDATEGYKFSGFAGFNNMTRLCSIGSDNTNPILSGVQNVEFSPCRESVILVPNKSIEYILAEQISLRMANCTDFSVFKDDNITVSGMPETKIIYTSESVLVKVTYNLTVKIKNKEPVFVRHTFDYKSNLRLAKLHNYVMSLVRADSQDFFFNLYDNYKSYGIHNEINPEKLFDEEYMTVKIINFTDCINCPHQYDRLLIVEDTKSVVRGRSLIYMTMLKNRIPALDYIHLTSTGSPYDVVVSNNQEITLEPQGYDPDDDKNITYIYEGWKETFDEVCEFPPIIPGQPISPSEATCNPVLDSGYTKWTSSQLFIASGRRANYTTNISDMGPHNVTITARDTSGLEDYQIVKILVFDLPKAVISPLKLYNMMPENVTSIEDNFTLDGSLSTASVILNGNLKNYIWEIQKLFPSAGLVFKNITEMPVLIVPTEYYDVGMTPDLLIQKIKPMNLSNTGIHNVSLVIESYLPQYDVYVLSTPEYMTLRVEECVPYENPADFPFPYNTGADPFLANHSCCNADYTVVNAPDYACYNKVQYGELNLLRAENKVELNNARFDSYQPSEVLIDTASFNLLSQRNDIYQMTFKRFCDGNRGNICAGAMERTIEFYAGCEDKSISEEETCRGPSSSLSDFPVGCTDYAPGDSFEKTFNLPVIGGAADGTCNTQKICSRPGVNGYGAAGGKMRCDAQCSGGSCTFGAHCDCSRASCGAVCDASYMFNWTGTTCRHGCDLSNTCNFVRSTPLPCSQGNSYCFSGDYCHINVVCTANGGFSETKDYCRLGHMINTNICYYAPIGFNLANRCAADGACSLLKSDRLTLPNCPDGQSHVCNNNQGWICQ